MAIPVLQEYAVGQVSAPGLTCDVDVSGLTISAGDLLIGILVTDGTTETHTSPDSDSWTAIQKDITDGTNMTASTWWKTASGSEGTLTFGCGSSEEMIAWVLRITGHNSSAPVDSNSASSSGDDQTPVCPTMTTQYNNELLLRIFGADDADGDNGDQWSDTARTTTHIISDQNTDTDVSGAFGTQEMASAGSVSTETYTMAAVEEWASFTIGIREPSAGWANIAKVSGVAVADFAKVNNVAVASIAKVNGVAV